MRLLSFFLAIEIFFSLQIAFASDESQTDNRRPKVFDKLIVNTDPSTFHVVEKTWADAVPELRQLVETATQEEAWIVMEIHGETIWIQNSFGEPIRIETNKSVALRVEINTDLSGLSQLSENLSLVHFHPVSGLPRMEQLKSWYPEADVKALLSFKVLHELQLHMPSFGDLRAFAEMKDSIKNGRTQFSARIFGPLGVVNFGLKKKGKKVIETQNLEEFEKTILKRIQGAMLATAKRLESLKLVPAALDPQQTEDALKYMLKQFSGNEFDVTFVSYDDFDPARVQKPSLRGTSGFFGLCRTLIERIASKKKEK